MPIGTCGMSGANQGAFPELLGLTEGGILYEPNEPEVLADAMEKLLLDPERGRELGRKGRKAVFEKFSVESMSQNVLKVIETVLAGTSPSVASANL